ncbi:MAG: CcmD family protein [Luteibaculum sp.]
MKRRNFPIILAVLASNSLFANQGQVQEFDGKYGVFAAVALIVLFGIFLYLIRLDRKVAKLEKKSKED